MPVQVGLALKNFVGPGESPDPQAILAYAERAEALGFESLWAWDHILLGVEPAFPILDAFSILSAIAARTSRIRLGTGVLVLPLRNPVVTAKVAASLDQISRGRLILGVATGWYAREFDACGVPFKERGRLLERNLDLLLRLWGDAPVTAQVDQLNLREAVIVPKPFQKPRPPILIGGYVDAVLRRVARVADGWLTYFYTPESFEKSWTKIRDYAASYGRRPEALTATNQLAIYVGPPKAKADPPMREWLSTEWDVAAWSDSTIEHAIRGTPEECLAQLRPHVATGVDRLILIPYRYRPDQVELIAREILPALIA
ncbi:MAG: TIGR03619 family F420-dependent LLM class oxidoreductase [Candidatus Rokubacteria bacterium]|nr:TIGR03619 family F420-dependent LLM class oxidoreductase [Candidatus Rokubacteria bacterium]